MALKRVVVTGLGALTPIGNNLNDFWTGLIEGKSGAAPITYFDTEKFKTKFACELKDFDVSLHLCFSRHNVFNFLFFTNGIIIIINIIDDR